MVHVLERAAAGIDDVAAREEELGLLFRDLKCDGVLFRPGAREIAHGDKADWLRGGGARPERALTHHRGAELHAVGNLGVEWQPREFRAVAEVVLLGLATHRRDYLRLPARGGRCGFRRRRGRLCRGLRFPRLKIEHEPHGLFLTHRLARYAKLHGEFAGLLIREPREHLHIGAGERSTVAGLHVGFHEDGLRVRGDAERDEKEGGFHGNAQGPTCNAQRPK